MSKDAILTSAAPSPIGPYSQAIRAGGFLFASGQIPIAPDTGAIPLGGIVAQTRQVLLNLEAVLRAAGGSLASVVKTTVFLKDLADFPAMNEVYATFFRGEPPARSTVQVARLPKDALIEIEAIAWLVSACGDE